MRLKESKFIGKFVNNVYPILLGVGFAKVVEVLLKGANTIWIVTHLVMSIFITVVVCLYWWDWSENIETRVQSSFSEFTIDILILFTLEFLFFLFKDPTGLALLFVVISVLNLVWVLNYLWEKHKHSPDSIGYLRNRGDIRYVLQKIYGIITYGVCLLVIYWIEMNFALNDNGTYILCGGILVIFFVLNRWIAFGSRPL